MTRRTRSRIETGFKSLRDLLICCIGAYGFWFQVTRVAHPEPTALAFCCLLMAVPGILSVWRITNSLAGGLDEERLREMVREELAARERDR